LAIAFNDIRSTNAKGRVMRISLLPICVVALAIFSTLVVHDRRTGGVRKLAAYNLVRLPKLLGASA
jgi:hypothetical protein